MNDSVCKSITVSKANSWLDAIINKAIDIGEIVTHYVGYVDSEGVTKIMPYTSYDVSDNLEITVFSDFIAVTYFGKAKRSWYYNLTL